jgi:hypothetical protein
MRYRQLDANGDYVVGQPFLTNTPATVAQAAQTRLKLWRGEWFLNTADGTPWLQSILGKGQNPDPQIQQRILGTPGVTSITAYSSSASATTRGYTVTCTIATLYDDGTGNNTASFQVTL